MSATATSFSPLLESLLASAAQLSRDEKVVLVERVEAELAETDEVPQWHLEILDERTRLATEGRDKALPAEEAFRHIRASLGRQGSRE